MLLFGEHRYERRSAARIRLQRCDRTLVTMNPELRHCHYKTTNDDTSLGISNIIQGRRPQMDCALFLSHFSASRLDVAGVSPLISQSHCTLPISRHTQFFVIMRDSNSGMDVAGKQGFLEAVHWPPLFALTSDQLGSELGGLA